MARRSVTDNRELLVAISDNDIDKVERLLNEETDVNLKDRHGNTPLYRAIESGNPEMIRLLVNTGKLDVESIEKEVLMDYVKRLDRPDITRILETSLGLKPQVQDENLAEKQIQFGKIDAQALSIYNKFALKQFRSETQSSSKQPANAIHGNIYQLKLLMLFLYRGVLHRYSFRLGTEIAEAEKFDDLVFEYVQDGKKFYRLVQAKHKWDETKRITAHNLLGEVNGNYGLVKYFISYQKSKNRDLFKDGSIKDIIICTNIDWDRENLKEQQIMIEEMKDKDDILDMRSIGKQSQRYKFHIDLASSLKSKIEEYRTDKSTKASIKYTESDVKDFLNHLVFAVNQPNEDELGKIIEDEIGKKYGFSCSENIYNKLFVKMSNMLMGKGDRFFSYEEGIEFFEKANAQGSIWFNVKDQTPVFAGRSAQLANLHNTLQSKAKSQLLAVCGLGGVGKSALARRYIDKHCEEYDNNIVWINAENYHALVDTFHRLASDVLGISTTNADNKEKEIRSIVEDVYKYFSKTKSLFIFNNAEKHRNEGEFDCGIENFLPSLSPSYNKPYVLITSRNSKWPRNVQVLKLDVLDENEATEFMKRSLDTENDREECCIVELVRQLHCLPLALQQAVAYITAQDEKLKNLGAKFIVQDYLEKYKEEAEEILNFEFTESGDSDYAKTIFTIWNVTLDTIKMKGNGKDALEIINISSYLASEDIPSKIFLGLIDNKETVGSAIELLKQFSMVDVKGTMLAVHRLVQQVIRMKLKKENLEEKILARALGLFNKSNANSETINHVISVWNHSKKYQTLVKRFLYIPSYIGYAYLNGARYNEAYSINQEFLELVDTLPVDINVVISKTVIQNNMGMSFLRQGEYNKAIQILQESLDATKAIGLPIEDIHPLKENLGLALYEQGRYGEALKHFQEVYDVMKVRLGSDNADTARVKAQIASIFQTQGEHDKALPMLKEACYVLERDLGANHAATLDAKNGMAGVLASHGKYHEALEILQIVYRDTKATRKDNDTSVLSVQANIGSILHKLGKFDDALNLCKEVLNVQEKTFKDGHPDILVSRRNIVEILKDLGKYDEAMTLCRQILNKSKHTLGDDHPDTLRVQHTQASILKMQQKYDGALKLYEEVLNKWKRIFKDDHAESVTISRAIAMIHVQQGKYNEALIRFMELYKIQETKLGKNHLDTLRAKQDIGLIFHRQENYNEALQIYQECLDKIQTLYPDYNDPFDTKYSIALVLSGQQKHDEALKLFREILDFVRVMFGEESERTAAVKGNISASLMWQGKYKEAWGLARDSFKIFARVFGSNNSETLKVRDILGNVLLAAIRNNDIKEIKEFFERDTERLMVANFNNAVILHCTINWNRVDILNVLLENGADVISVNIQGQTPLHVAATRGYGEIVERLLQYVKRDELNSFVNAKTAIAGSTALHIVAEQSYPQIVKSLLKRGAMYNVKNKNGRTPLSLSTRQPIVGLLKLLDKLFGYARNGNDRLVKELQAMEPDEYEAVINARDNEGNVLCRVIQINGQANLLRRFLELLKRRSRN